MSPGALPLSAALSAPATMDRRRFDAEAGRLVGGRCTACGVASWPRRSVCRACGSAGIEEVVLPAAGTLLTWTRVWVPVEGLAPPYALGLVDLGGVAVFAHLAGDLDSIKVPAPVRVHVESAGRPPFWFELSA